MRNIEELDGLGCPYNICIGRLEKQQDGTYKCSNCETVVRDDNHYRRKLLNFSRTLFDVSAEIIARRAVGDDTKLLTVISDEGHMSLKEAV